MIMMEMIMLCSSDNFHSLINMNDDDDGGGKDGKECAVKIGKLMEHLISLNER